MASQMHLAASILTNEDILELLYTLANEEDLSVTINETMKGATITGIGAFVGGLFLGPPGFALGGAVGGLAACGAAKNFKPVSQIFCEMSEGKKALLCKKVKNVLIYTVGPHLIPMGGLLLPTLIHYVSANPTVHDEILKIMKTFVVSDLGLNFKA